METLFLGEGGCTNLYLIGSVRGDRPAYIAGKSTRMLLLVSLFPLLKIANLLGPSHFNYFHAIDL